jgi:hypothetical protein
VKRNRRITTSKWGATSCRRRLRSLSSSTSSTTSTYSREGKKSNGKRYILNLCLLVAFFCWSSFFCGFHVRIDGRPIMRICNSLQFEIRAEMRTYVASSEAAVANVILPRWFIAVTCRSRVTAGKSIQFAVRVCIVTLSGWEISCPVCCTGLSKIQ